MKPKKPIAKLHRSELIMAAPEYYDMPKPAGMATRGCKSAKATGKKPTSKRTSKK